MTYSVYIIYSRLLDKYYIGYTEDLELRISQHNQGHYSDSYTKISDDWQLFYLINCDSKNQAIKIETHIKKMKSKIYLENLKKYPEIGLKLLEKF
jgi:putative endonuclease